MSKALPIPWTLHEIQDQYGSDTIRIQTEAGPAIYKGIKEIEIGQVIEAHSTDPGSMTDFPAWARTSGNEILKTEQEDDVIKFYIKRNV